MNFNVYTLASLTLLFSALMHFTITILGNFSNSVLLYSAFGVLFLVLSAALWKQKRNAAWLGFLILLAGVSVPLSGLNSYTVTNELFYLTTLLNITAFIALFYILWHQAPPLRSVFNNEKSDLS